ncbi:Crp/Fnr family transcriptional regulator [Listeria fleischmannii]|uniref:Crp/Fnr family transcriptional regulator n=1 Tax=Listeria fleischmannii TaxID=1069827 RepID=UPI0016240807|nr:Crp/Fnr family transcriptional regulator [Listeria fleischmannii]MBC1418493.1 Crp/Fnr family transcriptional regulator [Listeria fleischmannii]
MLKNKTSEILLDLNQNKADSDWVRIMSIPKTSSIPGKYFKEEFIIVLEGVLHLGNKNKQIILFFSEGDVINQQVSDLNITNKLELICDTDVKLAFVYREYFLNFATNKPSYLEWLLEMSLSNNLNLYNEIMKHDYSTEDRLMYSLRYLSKKLNISCEDGFCKLPPFINKVNLSKYSNLSRKYLDIMLDSLVQQNLIRIESKSIYVKV